MLTTDTSDSGPSCHHQEEHHMPVSSHLLAAPKRSAIDHPGSDFKVTSPSQNNGDTSGTQPLDLRSENTPSLPLQSSSERTQADTTHVTAATEAPQPIANHADSRSELRGHPAAATRSESGDSTSGGNSTGNSCANEDIGSSSPMPSLTAEPQSSSSNLQQQRQHQMTMPQSEPSDADADAAATPKTKIVVTRLPDSDTCRHKRTAEELPAGLRNKKMKPTDCLLFAATLLDNGSETMGTSNTINDDQPSPRNPQVMHDETSFSRLGEGNKFPSINHTMASVPRTPKAFTTQKTQTADQDQHDADRNITGGLEEGVTPNTLDVLCGRGGLINKHPGNVIYRKVVDYNRPFYQKIHKKHRILVSQSIVQSIFKFGGRFLIQGAKGDSWMEIGCKRAVQKTSQALRERSSSGTSEEEPQGTSLDLPGSTEEELPSSLPLLSNSGLVTD